MAVFWTVAPCIMVEVYRHSEVLAASIIRAMRYLSHYRDYAMDRAIVFRFPVVAGTFLFAKMSRLPISAYFT
jgi:hypothetical protein